MQILANYIQLRLIRRWLQDPSECCENLPKKCHQLSYNNWWHSLLAPKEQSRVPLAAGRLRLGRAWAKPQIGSLGRLHTARFQSYIFSFSHHGIQNQMFLRMGNMRDRSINIFTQSNTCLYLALYEAAFPRPEERTLHYSRLHSGFI